MGGYSDSDLPTRYGRTYALRADRLQAGATGDAIRALQTGGLLAGVPVELLCAFIAPSNRTNNTTDARTGKGAQVAFHEVGWWQIPAGPALRDAQGVPRGPAPATDPRAQSNTWGRLASDPDVCAALGRSAAMADRAWKDPAHEIDQHAIGLAMLRDDFRAVAAKMGPSIRPADLSSQWAWAVMLTSFSAGPGGAADLFNAFGSRIEDVPEAYRFGALINAVALEWAAGHQSRGHADHHGDREHRVLRTWQKFETARQAAEAGHSDARRFDVRLGTAQAAHERAILRANWDLSPEASDRANITPVNWSAVAAGEAVGLLVP